MIVNSIFWDHIWYQNSKSSLLWNVTLLPLIEWGSITKFTIFTIHFNLLTSLPPIYWNFDNFPPLPIIVNPSNLTESRWEEKYFVLVQGFHTVFSKHLEDQNMPFWLVLGISKVVEDHNLPINYEWFE